MKKFSRRSGCPFQRLPRGRFGQIRTSIYASASDSSSFSTYTTHVFRRTFLSTAARSTLCALGNHIILAEIGFDSLSFTLSLWQRTGLSRFVRIYTYSVSLFNPLPFAASTTLYMQSIFAFVLFSKKPREIHFAVYLFEALRDFVRLGLFFFAGFGI